MNVCVCKQTSMQGIILCALCALVRWLCISIALS